jgi:hypothetical protein
MATKCQKILAAPVGRVAVTLDVLAGFIDGYLYLCRWRQYWFTSVLATTWFVPRAVMGQSAKTAEQLVKELSRVNWQ